MSPRRYRRASIFALIVASCAYEHGNEPGPRSSVAIPERNPPAARGGGPTPRERDVIAEALCRREVRCGGINEQQPFQSYEDCVTYVGASGSNVLGTACTPTAAAARACADALGDQPCDEERFPAPCEEELLCGP